MFRVRRDCAIRLVGFFHLFAIFVPASAMSMGERLPVRFWDDVARVRVENISPVEKSASIKLAYQNAALTALRHLDRLGVEELHALFGAVKTSNFFAQTADYPSRVRYREAMMRVFDEMAKRKVAKVAEAEAYYEALVVARDFDRAGRLVKAFRGPEYVDYSHLIPSPADKLDGSTGYVLNNENVVQLRSDAIPKSGSYVVVVVGCHFAEDAARSIRSDPQLAEALSRVPVIWIMSANELDERVLRDWNDAFPEYPGMIAFDNAKWEGVDFNAIPAFHFFREGKKVSSFSGWEPGESGAALLRSIASIVPEAGEDVSPD
ncbi:hypothetical protein [Luteibacter sp.]|uniref:hypothetical protein n=1 Tax=Luteibacter sp. TaxID=1886636 RepID=UPI003F81F332